MKLKDVPFRVLLEHIYLDEVDFVNFNLKKDEFDRVTARYCLNLGPKQDIPWIAQPWNMARQLGDSEKRFRYLFYAVILNWTELKDGIAEALKRDGYTWNEIKRVKEYLMSTKENWLTLAAEELDKVNQVKQNNTLAEEFRPEAGEILDDEENLEDVQLLLEKVEKHDTLNPKLFNKQDKLKPEVREKMLQMVNLFLDDLEEDGIKLILKDIVLIGSNASYNYNDKSDADVHIIADADSLHCPDNLYPILYSAYRNIFNKKFDIDFYGIPVELYVETEGMPTVSNGCYSVKDNEWIKVPEQTDIPDIDETALKKEFKNWEDKYKELVKNIKGEKITPEDAEVQTKDFITEIYDLRKKSLQTDGEYGLGNLVFKEFRNHEYLSNLKDLRDRSISKKLSLESLHEMVDRRTLDNIKLSIARATGQQAIIYPESGRFYIYNINENEVNSLINQLKQLPFIIDAQRGAAGGYNFSHINQIGLPTRKFTVTGYIKTN